MQFGGVSRNSHQKQRGPFTKEPSLVRRDKSGFLVYGGKDAVRNDVFLNMYFLHKRFTALSEISTIDEM